MHDYNTIIGVIELCSRKISLNTTRQCYGIGNSGVPATIMNQSKENLLRI